MHRSATRFLHSSEARAVDLNGHEIDHCFKVAIALATAQAKRSEGNVVIVKDSHFKEAMNVEHEFRQYMRSLSGYSIDKLTKRDKLRNDSFLQEREYPSLSDSDSSISAHEDEEAEGDDSEISSSVSIPKEQAKRSSADIPISIPKEQAKSLLETSQRSVTLNSDSDLCIPDLNRAGWDAFRAAGAKELFRKTKFYAIDVLEGEPLIKLHIDNQKRRKRQNLTQKGVSSESTITQAASQDRRAPSALEPGKAALPERIRINSPAIIRAFAEIHGDSNISRPFLLFRPFRSLLYYEQEFRDMINQQENTLQGDIATLKPFSLQPTKR